MLDEGIGKGLINRAIGLSSLSFCHKSGKVVYLFYYKKVCLRNLYSFFSTGEALIEDLSVFFRFGPMGTFSVLTCKHFK